MCNFATTFDVNFVFESFTTKEIIFERSAFIAQLRVIVR